MREVPSDINARRDSAHRRRNLLELFATEIRRLHHSRIHGENKTQPTNYTTALLLTLSGSIASSRLTPPIFFIKVKLRTSARKATRGCLPTSDGAWVSNKDGRRMGKSVVSVYGPDTQCCYLRGIRSWHSVATAHGYN